MRSSLDNHGAQQTAAQMMLAEMRPLKDGPFSGHNANTGHRAVVDTGATIGSRGGLELPPADLPFNVPDRAKYPYARYTGLHDFTLSLPQQPGWDFVVNLGGERDITPHPVFWERAFATSTVLSAYFSLRSAHRVKFTQIVSWIRDPLPGRPGGVQIPPPEWPPNLPTPIHHGMTRYAGFAEWVASIGTDWAEVARVSLFGVHEQFDPVWWADYHKTVDVYRLYARLSSELRESFVSGVTWIPDGTWSASSEDDAGCMAQQTAIPSVVSAPRAPVIQAGYCYEVLFREEHRARVRGALGRNPWAVSVAAALLAEPGVWNSGTFTFSTGARYTGSGQAYVQGHISRGSGVGISSLLPHLHGLVRLGATSDINALANLQGQDTVSSVPTLFPTKAARSVPASNMVYNVYAVLDMTSTSRQILTWNIMNHPAFTVLLGAFESAVLDHAAFTLQVSTGAQNSVLCAICAPDRSLATTSDWLATPINTEIHGSDQGYVSGSFELPAKHSFEKEIRSPDGVGNPVPSFRFALKGSATAKVVIKGSVGLQLRGQYSLGHIDIGPSAPVKAASRMRRQIVDSLPYDVDGTTQVVSASEDDSDSEAEDAPQGRASANTSARRSP